MAAEIKLCHDPFLLGFYKAIFVDGIRTSATVNHAVFDSLGSILGLPSTKVTDVTYTCGGTRLKHKMVHVADGVEFSANYGCTSVGYLVCVVCVGAEVADYPVTVRGIRAGVGFSFIYSLPVSVSKGNSIFGATIILGPPDGVFAGNILAAGRDE